MLSDDARIAVESEVSAILVHPIRLRLEKNTTTKADVGRRRGWGQRRVVTGATAGPGMQRLAPSRTHCTATKQGRPTSISRLTTRDRWQLAFATDCLVGVQRHMKGIYEI